MLVVAPAKPRLASEITVDVQINVGTLLLGAATLPAIIRLRLPDDFVLGPRPGFSPQGVASPLPGGAQCELEAPNGSSCTIRLIANVRLRADLVYAVRLEGIRTPAGLSSGQPEGWQIEVFNSGTARGFQGSALQDGIRFLLGADIPTSWAFFPYVTALPLSVGPALVSLSFRPYANPAAKVTVIAPSSFRFATICQDFELVPATPGVSCSGTDANAFSVRSSELEFSVQVTFSVRLKVLHALSTASPLEGAHLLGDGNVRWQVEFSDRDGYMLAHTQHVAGYPVWSAPLGFEGLQFLTLPPSTLELAVEQALQLIFTMSVSMGHRSDSAPVLRLYAPAGFQLNCTSVETKEVFRLRRVSRSLSRELPVASASCFPAGNPSSAPWLELTLLRPSPSLSLLAAPILTAGERFMFEVAATTPGEPRKDRGSIGADEAARTWYMSIAEPPSGLSSSPGGATAASACGNKLRVEFAPRRLEMTLAVGSSVLGGVAVLWAFIILETLLSSPAHGGRGWIELLAPTAHGYEFTAPCSVWPAVPASSSVRSLPAGSSCERVSATAVRIYIPHGVAMVPEVVYAFLLRSVKMPTEIGSTSSTRRLLSDSVCTGSASAPAGQPRRLAENWWSAAAFASDGTALDMFFPASEVDLWPTLVPALGEFAFSPIFSSSSERRFGDPYVAAFTFRMPPTFATPINFLRISAPSMFAFAPDDDCSPDSLAAVEPYQGVIEEIDRSQLTGAVTHLLPGWCRASPYLPVQRLLPSGGTEDGRTEGLMPTGLQSAVLSLPRQLSDFVQRYMFRVHVRHPDRRVATGDNTWSLDVLNEDRELVAQMAGLDTYRLVGSAEVTLRPSNTVLSATGRRELNVVGIVLQLSSVLPPAGSLVLRLGGGVGPGEATHIPVEMINEMPCQAFQAAFRDAVTTSEIFLPVGCLASCSASELRIIVASPGLLADTEYIFWVVVANPSARPSTTTLPWSFQTAGPDGKELDTKRDIPNYGLADAPLPLLALSTSSPSVLADRAVTILLFFSLPAGEMLTPGSQLSILAPKSFTFPPDEACGPVEQGSASGRSSFPASLAEAAASAWSALHHQEASAQAMPLPLPPFVACTVTDKEGRDAVDLVIPGRLQGGEPYIVALGALCPSQTPSSGSNMWQLRVLRQVNFQFRLAFEAAVEGFPLVPKLQQERILPYRSLNDALFKQSQMFPEAASLVSLRLEFQLPFLAEQLKDVFRIAIDTPEGFEVGLAGTGQLTARSCKPVELLIGREPLPIQRWVACNVASASLMWLVIQVPPPELLNAEAEDIAGQSHRLIKITVEAFPLLPPGSTEDLDQRRWNLHVSTCSGSLAMAEQVEDCRLLAASTELPTWGMFGYLHVDRVFVDYPGRGDPLPLGFEAHSEWAGARLSIIQFQGVRVSTRLLPGSSFRVVAPAGYEFRAAGAGSTAPLDASSLQTSNLPPLDTRRCEIVRPALADTQGIGETLVLHFTGPVNGDQLFSFALAAKFPQDAAVASGTGATLDNIFRLETRLISGDLLDVQRDVGRWDRTLGLPFVLLAAVAVSVPGSLFDLAVFFQVPEVGLGSLTSELPTSIRLLAPSTFGFDDCDGAAKDNTRLNMIPSVPGLRDHRVLPGVLWALPEASACAAHGSSLAVSLGGRRRGSGRGVLRGEVTYAFSWPVRILVGRQLPFRPRAAARAAGEAVADLFLGDDPASPENMLGRHERWELSLLLGARRILTSTVETFFESRATSEGYETRSVPALEDSGRIRLEVQDLTPVWVLPVTPYYGESSLAYIVFSIGKRPYPAGSRLRVSLKPLDPLRGQNMEFLPCEQQAAAFRRQSWEDPLGYFSKGEAHWGRLRDIYLELPERPPNSELQVVQFVSQGCKIDRIGANATASLRMTLELRTMLIPPAEQYLLVLAVDHRYHPGAAHQEGSDLLTLEVLDSVAERVLARSHDLSTYPLARRMSLTRWEFSSNDGSSENMLDVEFVPTTNVKSSQAQPQIIGFALLAPVTFRFTGESCRRLSVERTKHVYDLMTEVNETQSILFKDMPSCEVAKSEWLADGGYYQNQLVIYMPALVELQSSVFYRVKVPVLNAPLPGGHLFMKMAMSARTSPKYSQSSLLQPLLNTWRVFTFTWETGDAGGNGVPFAGTASSAALGRVGGIRKIDEVVWSGFEVTET